MISSVRTGMVSTLLADTYAGTPFEDLCAEWNALANPTVYMRAIEAPSAGNVAAAERIFAELGITHRDLDRRFLLRTEISKRAWQRQPAFKAQDEKTAPRLAAMEWRAATFSRSSRDPSWPQLSQSRPPCQHHNAVMCVTGLPGSVPLMQCHTETNLASTYFYSQQRNVATYGLKAGWVEVHSIRSFPCQWDDDSGSAAPSFPQHGRRWLLALDGLAEPVAPTGTLFAAYMQPRFHCVRSTIEAQNGATVSGKESMGAEGVAGWMVDVNPKPEAALTIRMRVTDARGKQTVFELTSEGESDVPPKEPAAEGQVAAVAPGGVAVTEGSELSFASA